MRDFTAIYSVSVTKIFIPKVRLIVIMPSSLFSQLLLFNAFTPYDYDKEYLNDADDDENKKEHWNDDDDDDREYCNDDDDYNNSKMMVWWW